MNILGEDYLLEISSGDTFLEFLERLIQGSCVGLGWIVSDYYKC
jgi:hypothetical protein